MKMAPLPPAFSLQREYLFWLEVGKFVLSAALAPLERKLYPRHYKMLAMWQSMAFLDALSASDLEREL
jgi:hypothetical protein